MDNKMTAIEEYYTRWLVISRHVAEKYWHVSTHPTRKDAREFVAFIRPRNPLLTTRIMKRDEVTL